MLFSSLSGTSVSQLLGVNLATLRTTIDEMNVSVEQQSICVFNDLSHWQQYATESAAVRPWLEEAELRQASANL